MPKDSPRINPQCFWFKKCCGGIFKNPPPPPPLCWAMPWCRLRLFWLSLSASLVGGMQCVGRGDAPSLASTTLSTSAFSSCPDIYRREQSISWHPPPLIPCLSKNWLPRFKSVEAIRNICVYDIYAHIYPSPWHIVYIYIYIHTYVCMCRSLPPVSARGRPARECHAKHSSRTCGSRQMCSTQKAKKKPKKTMIPYFSLFLKCTHGMYWTLHACTNEVYSWLFLISQLLL